MLPHTVVVWSTRGTLSDLSTQTLAVESLELVNGSFEVLVLRPGKQKTGYQLTITALAGHQEESVVCASRNSTGAVGQVARQTDL